MTLLESVRAAREANDWDRLVRVVPFAAFLQLRMDVKGDEFTCVLPAQERLVGNPWLPALHGGVTAGFMECAAILFLLWHRDSSAPPKTVDFGIDYLRTGKVQDTFANVHMVKFGARVANVRVTAWQSSPDHPIAVAHGNYLLAP